MAIIIGKKQMVSLVYEDLLEKGIKTSKKNLVLIADAMFDSLATAMLKGSKIEIRGFGVFYPIRKYKKNTWGTVSDNYKIGTYTTKCFKPSRFLINKVNGISDVHAQYFSGDIDFD